nr:MAG TPA: Endonuclease [Caudoviricetes sp.]
MMALAARGSKYHAKKTVVDGIEFDSAKEGKRYARLRALEDAGKIQGLRLQVPFELLPSFECDGVKYRGMKYVADFVYYRDGKVVVEDCKGFKTTEYKMKKKLMAYINHINIEES